MENSILRLPQLMAKVGMSRSAVYAAVRDGHLPASVKLRTGGRSVGWLAHEVENHLAKMAESRGEVVK